MECYLIKDIFRRLSRLIPFAVIVLLFLAGAGLRPSQHKDNGAMQADEHTLFSGENYQDIRGFRSNINVIITLNPQNNTIEKIDFLPNQEDDRFWNKVISSGIFTKYYGLSPNEAAKLPLDAVTGATFSSSAAEQTIHAMLNDYLDLAPEPAENQPFPWRDIGAAILIIFNIFIFIRPVKSRARTTLLIVNIILFGFIFRSYLSIQQISSWLGALPYIALSLPLVLFIVIALVGIIKGNNFYCTWLCPFGGAQEIIAKLSSRAGVKSIPLKIKHPGILRRIILLAVLAAAWLNIALPVWEPFAIFNLIPDYIVWIIAIVFLGASCFFPRIWCRLFCGCGELLDWFSKPLFKSTTAKTARKSSETQYK